MKHKRIFSNNDEIQMRQEASLFISDLEDWRKEPMAIDYGAIIICRSGSGTLRINFKEWHLSEGGVIIVFPHDVVLLKTQGIYVEMLQYSASLLREASLQLEQTVYSSLREDRCRQDTPVITNIINNIFSLLRIYFQQNDCTCVTQLVMLQLKAFFIGFHDYLQRNPQYRPDEIKSRRIRELFNQFMMLLERDYKNSRDVRYYAMEMNISPKYLTKIVCHVTPHTPKAIIDQYVVLQLKSQLHLSEKSIKEIAWDFHFSDVSFFCRYFKRLTGLSPQAFRK